MYVRRRTNEKGFGRFAMYEYIGYIREYMYLYPNPLHISRTSASGVIEGELLFRVLYILCGWHSFPSLTVLQCLPVQWNAARYPWTAKTRPRTHYSHSTIRCGGLKQLVLDCKMAEARAKLEEEPGAEPRVPGETEEEANPVRFCFLLASRCFQNIYFAVIISSWRRFYTYVCVSHAITHARANAELHRSLPSINYIARGNAGRRISAHACM